MAYEKPPEPGTYYIKSVAAPKNVIEVPKYNEERAVCSPQTGEPAKNQQWYIQRSGRGYKIKNVQYGVYFSSYSTQPKNATPVGTSPSHGPVDWYILRTHDGFVIQYGEKEVAVDLHYGLDKGGNPMHLWGTAPQAPHQRWKFERISDDIGGEVAETVEDRITALSDQLHKMGTEMAKKDAEITAKDRLLAQKEQELQDALQNCREASSPFIQSQLAEMRNRIEGLRYLVEFLLADYYIMSYPNFPEPGTYYIKSVAAPKNVIEVLDYNQERAACSPQATQPNQQWYVQRSGRGYKIKNLKHGVYLAPHSAHPNYATFVGASPNHGPLDWILLRVHDGFAIQYGNEDLSIALHYGSDQPGSPILLWHTKPEHSDRRWQFQRISDDVGGETAESVEDRIAILSDQIRRKDAEIAAKDQLLAEKDRELRQALEGRHELP